MLLLPFAGVLIPLGLWFFVDLNPSLTAQEKELMAFIPVKVALSRPVVQPVFKVNCPIPGSPPPSAAGNILPTAYPPLPLAAMAPVAGGNARKTIMPGPVYRLSLVLMDEGRKIAIINGQVLREGEALGSYLVSHIEKNRVNLKGLKGGLWVKLE